MSLKPPFDGQPRTILRPANAPRLILIGAADLTGLPPSCRLWALPAPPRLRDLTADWIAESRIDAVAFAVFAASPDAWQIGAHLTRLGFAGRILALSPVLPNRAMVERELRADFPALRLRVMPVLGNPS